MINKFSTAIRTAAMTKKKNETETEAKGLQHFDAAGEYKKKMKYGGSERRGNEFCASLLISSAIEIASDRVKWAIRKV